MRLGVIPKFRPFFLLLPFAFLCLTAHAAPVRFVQITDPHLFDPGDQGEKNRAALAACIASLNRRMDEKADYQFAVVTGDIGIENLVSRIVNQETKKRELEDPTTQERKLEDGAAQLALILAPTKIDGWLFIPGNNDLYTELPDLQYYQKFLEKLRTKLPGL
jgi:3',5'-cyclic AMP phosphodiesterase CpdA